MDESQVDGKDTVVPPRYYPVELDLRGKSALMVGGGRVAARKLPELLACGAKVTVIAPDLDPALRRLLPALHWEARAFSPSDVSGHTLVFAATDSPEANAAVSMACRALGIPCNRADAAGQGDFIVPGLIRRGAVTLTASTSGQAPALTRHLKRKLSAAFGDEWAQLAALLHEKRKRDRRALADDGLALEPLAEALRNGENEKAIAFLNPLPEKSAPVEILHPVILAGAGPGDRDLLTLAVAQALQNAEVVVHDRLVDSGILELAPAACLRVPAEKRGHFESTRQEHINAQLVHWALQGKRVIRLKGGDPFVFGRGFEEIAALEAENIPWRLFPGLSSVTAVPALAGIPLTHRGLARSFAVASGMAGGGVNPTFPRADTLVLLMALYKLADIVPALVAAGYDPQTPAAAIENGGLPEQRVCRTTLEKLEGETAREGFDSPTLIVLGEVVRLSE